MQIPLISRIPWDRVNWTTSIFLAVINTLAVTAVPLYIWHYGLDWFQVALFFFFYIATGFSITLATTGCSRTSLSKPKLRSS